MRVILNLIPVCSGGGQQQAFRLLAWLASLSATERKNWLVLVGRGTHLHSWMKLNRGLRWKAVSRRYVPRILFETFVAPRLVRTFGAQIVLHFTAAWRRLSVPQVVRSVYSNLYFPEVDFWPRRPRLTYIKRKIVDWARLRGTLAADGLIFENRAMMRRAQVIFGFPAERVRYISPTAPALDGGPLPIVEGRGRFKVLYLTAWHENKNLTILPSVASVLKKRGLDVSFVLSLSADVAKVFDGVVAPAKMLGVSDFFEFVGEIPPEHVVDIIGSSDAMILLSKLECFSANIAEAWASGRPLIISDLEWARSECGEAAMYVDRDNATSIADAIEKLVVDEAVGCQLIEAGRRKLEAMGTDDSRFREFVAFLEQICEYEKRT